MEPSTVFVESEVASLKRDSEGLVATLRDSRVYYLASADRLKIIWRTINSFSKNGQHFMNLLGQATVDAQLYNVYEHCKKGRLSTRIRDMAAAGLRWRASDLHVFFRSVLLAFAELHARNYLHLRCSTNAFFLTATERLCVGRLESMMKAKQGFEESQREVMKRLGICFLSMLSLLDYHEIAPLSTHEKLWLCEQQPVPELAQLARGALKGLNPSQLLEDLKVYASQSPDRTPTLRSHSHGIEEWDGLLTNASMRTVGNEEESEHSLVCSVCRERAEFAPRCSHCLCMSCLRKYVEVLLSKRRLLPSGVVCKLCDKQLDLPQLYLFVPGQSDSLQRKLQHFPPS